MNSKVLIGLIGAPGAGKDVLADFLVENRGFRQFAFADKVKEGYYFASGFSEEQFKAARNTELEQTIRNGLWAFSDEMRSKYGNLYFIAPVIQEITACGQSVVVSDVRTPDELSQMESLGAIIIHVYRNPATEFGEYIPGTRIKPVFGTGLLFWNHYSNLDALWASFPEFFAGVC